MYHMQKPIPHMEPGTKYTYCGFSTADPWNSLDQMMPYPAYLGLGGEGGEGVL